MRDFAHKKVEVTRSIKADDATFISFFLVVTKVESCKNSRNFTKVIKLFSFDSFVNSKSHQNY